MKLSGLIQRNNQSVHSVVSQWLVSKFETIPTYLEFLSSLHPNLCIFIKTLSNLDSFVNYVSKDYSKRIQVLESD